MPLALGPSLIERQRWDLYRVRRLVRAVYVEVTQSTEETEQVLTARVLTAQVLSVQVSTAQVLTQMLTPQVLIARVLTAQALTGRN